MTLSPKTADRLREIADQLRSRERHGAGLTLRNMRDDLLDVIRVLMQDNPFHQHHVGDLRSGGPEYASWRPEDDQQGEVPMADMTVAQIGAALRAEYASTFRPSGRPAGIRIRVSCCDDMIQSRSQHDFVRCRCGKSFVDGGSAYLRWGSEDPATTIEEVPVG